MTAIDPVEVSVEEKRTGAAAIIMVASFLVYQTLIIVRSAAPGPLIEISWVAPMAWTMGISGLLSIAANVLIGIGRPKKARKRDVRDRDIERFGNTVAHAFVVIGGLVALVLLLIDVDRFWVTHALYYGFMVSGILGSFAKLGAYREGIQEL